MKNAQIIFRVLIGIIFLSIGLYHFYTYEFLAAFVPLPYGSKFFVCVIATLISAAAIGIILNKYTRLSVITLAIIFFITAFMTAIPVTMRETDEILREIGYSNLVKFGISGFLFFFLMFSKKGK